MKKMWIDFTRKGASKSLVVDLSKHTRQEGIWVPARAEINVAFRCDVNAFEFEGTRTNRSFTAKMHGMFSVIAESGIKITALTEMGEVVIECIAVGAEIVIYATPTAPPEKAPAQRQRSRKATASATPKPSHKAKAPAQRQRKRQLSRKTRV